MMEGKYEFECSMVRKMTNARMAMVIIIDGDRGAGFSVHIDAQRGGPELVRLVPGLLRRVADSIEKQNNEGRTFVEIKPA